MLITTMENQTHFEVSAPSSSGENPKIKSSYIDSGKLQEKPGGFSSEFTKIRESEFYEEPKPQISMFYSNKGGSSGKGQSKNCIIVSSRQRGNPILKFIRNIPWEYQDIVPDYIMSNTTCAMFLSLRYHTLNPNYIHDRLKILGQQYLLRILLVQVDIKDPHLELKQLTKICVFADLTLILAWSPEEAGRIIEVYKLFENKPPDLIMEKQECSLSSQVIDALTSIKSVNRTDALTLLSNFKSLDKIIAASVEELSTCPGLGPLKAKKLYNVLHQSFQKS